MARFGDFTLLDELAESEVADCFGATHDVQGGPFFLKRYRRVDPSYAPVLLYRCEALMAVQHDNLAPHLGHGDVDGVVFTVSPFLEGIDLDGFIESVRQRRVVVKLEAVLFIVREAARGVAALHAAAHDGQRALLAHGDVCTRHVRLGPAGEVWLTGLPTPRGLSPDRPPEPIWDCAGLGALLYDLMPLTRTGGQRPSLPGALDRVVRRTLGIGPASDQMPPLEFAERLDEVAEVLKLPRLEPRVLEDAAARAIQHHKNAQSMSAADALPTLEPVISEPQSRAHGELPPLDVDALDPFRETAPTERPAALIDEIDALPDEPLGGRPGPAGVAPTAARQASPAPERAAQRPPPQRPPPQRPPPQRPPPQRPPPRTSERPPSPARPPPVTPAAASDELDAFAARPTAPSHHPLAARRAAPPGAVDVDGFPHRAATPLDELGSLGTVPPVRAPSVPWVAPDDERTEAEIPRGVPHQGADGPVGLAPGDDDEPLDPFVEKTLPGHLVGLLPSDEPAAFEVNPTPVSPREAVSRPPSADTFESDSTRPEVSTLVSATARTQSNPARPPVPSAPEPPPADLPPASPGSELPSVLEVPREISALVKFDAPLRAQLGLLADPPEAAAARADDDNDSAFADSAFADSPFTDSDAAGRDTADSERVAGDAVTPQDPAVAALLARGVVTPQQVEEALLAQGSRGGKVSEILVNSGATTDALVADALAAEAVKPRLSDQGLFAHLPEPELCRRLPQTYALSRRMLPLVLEDGRLTLAVVDPFDDDGVREVTRLVGAGEVRVHVAARAALTDATLKAYRALHARLTTGEGTPSILLCMQDEEETARFGARLADEGFHIAHADDVPTAKMLLDAHPPAALILALDVEEAFELLLHARGHEEHAETPLFVTGEADEAAMAHILDLGADDFFERPTSLNVVMAKLRRALNKRGLHAHAPTTPPAATSTAGLAAAKRPAPKEPPPAAATRPVPEPAKPPPPEPPPPPTFDFWENSAPLDEMAEDDGGAPGDTRDNAPLYAEPTGVMGTLRQMAVTEIVQSLEMGRKTARVELVPTDGQRGMVGFEDGRVVYAECGELRGEQAFYSLAHHTEGFFRIRYGEGPNERNVEGSTTYLLLEAMRLMDESGGDDDGIGAEKTPTPFD